NLNLDRSRPVRELDQVVAAGADRQDSGQNGPLQFMDQEQHDSDRRILGDSLLVQDLRDFLAVMEMIGQVRPTDLPDLSPTRLPGCRADSIDGDRSLQNSCRYSHRGDRQ